MVPATHGARAYGFPWAQSTAYRASFIKPGVLGGIDPAAFVDERYRATLAQTSVRPGLPAAEQRMRQMMNLNFKWFMQTLLDRKDRMSMYSGLEGPRAVLRLPHCGVSLLGPMGVQGLSRAGKGPPARGHARRAARRGSVAAQSPYPQNVEPQLPGCCLGGLRTVLNDPAAPLLRIIRADALETLLASGADNPIRGTVS